MVAELLWSWFVFSLWVKYCGVTFLMAHLKKRQPSQSIQLSLWPSPRLPPMTPTPGWKPPDRDSSYPCRREWKWEKLPWMKLSKSSRPGSLTISGGPTPFAIVMYVTCSNITACQPEFIDHITCAGFMFCFLLPGEPQAVTRQHHQTPQGETEDRKGAWYDYWIIDIWELIFVVKSMLMPDLGLCPGRLWNKCPPAKGLIR